MMEVSSSGYLFLYVMKFPKCKKFGEWWQPYQQLSSFFVIWIYLHDIVKWREYGHVALFI
ncbi:hypothetical protein UP17_22720 [Peribacillus simplex]|nr:hypothetical protein UP17_22720 [Peribacillus simplex]